MLPVDALIWENRSIERMVPPIRKELSKINETKEANLIFIELVVDFIRTYADRCHHGKEDGILFRELAKKTMSDEHAIMMRELVKEHIYGRTTTRNLEKAKESYAGGNAGSLKDVSQLLSDLAEFYPKHIEKEDKHFFYPSIKYFTAQEQEAMLQEFWDFDRKIIHEKYKKTLDEMERITQNQP